MTKFHYTNSTISPSVRNIFRTSFSSVTLEMAEFQDATLLINRGYASHPRSSYMRGFNVSTTAPPPPPHNLYFLICTNN